VHRDDGVVVVVDDDVREARAHAAAGKDGDNATAAVAAAAANSIPGIVSVRNVNKMYILFSLSSFLCVYLLQMNQCPDPFMLTWLTKKIFSSLPQGNFIIASSVLEPMSSQDDQNIRTKLFVRTL